MIDVRGAGSRLRAATVRVIRSVFSRSAVPAWIVTGVVAVVAAVLISIGAFDTAVREPAAVAVGEEVRLSTYAVTVIDVEVTDAVEEQHFEADPGESLLLVTMRLENLTDTTVGVDSTVDRITSRLVNASESMIVLSGVDDPGNARVWHDATSLKSPLLQPGVPADITVGWRVDSSALDSDALALVVHDSVVRTGQIIIASDVVTWAQGTPVARIELETRG